MNSHSLIEKIKNEHGEKELKEIYCKYRNEFLIWAKRNFSCSDEDAKEVFQQSIVIFYENIICGKLTELASDLKTYLFGIGKRKMHELIRRNSKMSFSEFDDYQIDTSIFHKEEEMKAQNVAVKVNNCLEVLGDPCKSILVDCYYKKKSMNEISNRLNYKNGNTVKSLKYKCLQRLKKIFNSEARKAKLYKV